MQDSIVGVFCGIFKTRNIIYIAMKVVSGPVDKFPDARGFSHPADYFSGAFEANFKFGKSQKTRQLWNTGVIPRLGSCDHSVCEEFCNLNHCDALKRF